MPDYDRPSDGSVALWRGLATFFLLLGAVHAVSAQPLTSEDLEIEDASGDEVYVAPNGQEVGGSFPHADILRAWVAGETVWTFEVGMQLREWEGPNGADPNPEARLLAVQFTFKDKPFRVLQEFECGRQGFALQSAASEDAADQDWEFLACVPATVDPGRAIFNAAINKTLLMDAVSSAIRTGDGLQNVFALVRDRSTFDVLSQVTQVPTVVDRAPEIGLAVEFPFRLGLASTGDLELYAADPLRSTNGEIGTFVYAVEVRNHAGAAVTVILESVDVRAGWEVQHVPSARLAAKGSLLLPVFLNVGGAHQHGTAATWTLLANGSDGSEARLELGLQYPIIPQPSGHHPRIFLHSNDGNALERLAPWMNAAEQEETPGTTDSPFPGSSLGTGADGRTTFEWGFRQSPALAVGLDFDANREASMHVPFSTDVLVRQAVAEARLLYCPPAEAGAGPCEVVLVSGSSTIPDFGPGTVEVDIPLGIAQGIDVIPYQAGANLFLQVFLTGVSPPAGGTVRLDVDAAQLRLPLRDYQDAVEDVFGLSGALSMAPAGAAKRDANPGDAIMFAFRFKNEGSSTRTLTLGAEGTLAAWGTWRQSTLRLESGETQDVDFIVRVPEDATVGTEVTFFVFAESINGPTEILVARSHINVVETPVEGDLVPSENARGTPAAPVAWILLAVGLAMCMRRR